MIELYNITKVKFEITPITFDRSLTTICKILVQRFHVQKTFDIKIWWIKLCNIHLRRILLCTEKRIFCYNKILKRNSIFCWGIERLQIAYLWLLALFNIHTCSAFLLVIFVESKYLKCWTCEAYYTCGSEFKYK